jgi:hypothetical protein
MRRIAISAVLAVVVALAARALAPKLHQRFMAGCERMFEEMPDSFPPKRVIRGIDEIRANTRRTLELLEERERPVSGSERLDDVSTTTGASHAT